MYLNSKQIKRNIQIEKDLKAKRICSACGRKFSNTVKRSETLNDVCQTCERDFDNV
jgi:ribosomal protein L37AE/L43A